MNTRNTSCTTTGMAVGDLNANRIATQRTNEAAVAAEGRIPVAGSPDLSPMGEASQPAPIVVKQVDHVALEGSNKGDHRMPAAPVSMDAFKNPPSPREQMRGQQNSRSYSENGKAFQSTSNANDSDAGN